MKCFAKRKFFLDEIWKILILFRNDTKHWSRFWQYFLIFSLKIYFLKTGIDNGQLGKFNGKRRITEVVCFYNCCSLLLLLLLLYIMLWVHFRLLYVNILLVSIVAKLLIRVTVMLLSAVSVSYRNKPLFYFLLYAVVVILSFVAIFG